VSIEYLGQLLFNGLALAAVYALVALGLTLIFGVLGIVNFAHGELYMLAAMLAYFLAATAKLGYWTTTALVVVAAVIAGVVIYELLFRFLQGRDFQRSLLVTLGASMVLQNGAIWLWTANPRVATSHYSYATWTLGELRIGLVRLLAIAMAGVAFAAVWLVLHRTRVGKAMRGVSQNAEAALIVGIDPNAVSRLACALGIGLTGTVLVGPNGAGKSTLLRAIYGLNRHFGGGDPAR
jgi:branched-chain amino acid transport system permease protein